MTRSTVVALAGLACLVTLLNAFKPLTVDDTVYYWYARHIAAHPLDPYGFQVHEGLDANAVLTPLGVPYWWAAAYRLFGERPFLWKLWLLPFPLILTFSLYALCRRFARGLEMPLVVLMALSPTVLPCLNLMLDLPALALNLAALVVFIRACDRDGWGQAVAAGLIAFLAIQAKYTGFLAPAAMLLYAVCFRRIRFGVVAAALPLALFVGVECLIAHAYGESHFLRALHDREAPPMGKLLLVQPLLGILGGTASAAAVLGLAALGARRRVVLTAATVVLLGFAAVAFLPARYGVLLGGAQPGRPKLSVNTLVFGGFGLALCGLLAAAAWRLCRLGRPGAWRPRPWRRWRAEAFLALWLGLEIAGYFALSPYPAVRRVMGIGVVGVLLLGRLASRTCRAPERARLVWGAAAVSGLLGLAAFGADFAIYHAEQAAAEKAVRRIREQDPAAVIWAPDLDGAFTFYALHAGMRRLMPSDASPRPGDWLVDLRKIGDVEPSGAGAVGWETKTVYDVKLPAPLRSRYQYGGTALDHFEGPYLRVALCRRGG